MQITLGGWDLHNNTHASLLRPNMMPSLDRAMGTLVKDLEQRGKLKDTVIVWMGDFGRTPRINQNAGRDHWSRCWSVVLGGGAIKGGVVYGATDKDGTGIAKDEVSVADLYGTLYRGLGIDPTPETNASIRDNLGRPYYIAAEKPNEKTEFLLDQGTGELEHPELTDTVMCTRTGRGTDPRGRFVSSLAGRGVSDRRINFLRSLTPPARPVLTETPNRPLPRDPHRTAL